MHLGFVYTSDYPRRTSRMTTRAGDDKFTRLEDGESISNLNSQIPCSLRDLASTALRWAQHKPVRHHWCRCAVEMESSKRTCAE